MNHVLYNNLSIKDSQFYGNMGQQVKWSQYDNANVVFENNFVVTNCKRLSAPMPGAPTNYNKFLTGWCRASDGIALATGNNATTLVANNTVIGYASTTFDMSCSSPTGPCPAATSKFTYSNNILLAYADPTYNAAQFPGTYYTGANVFSTINRDHNDYWNMRNAGCPTTGFTGELCVDPAFPGEPATFVNESDLDVFSAVPVLPSGSALAGLGATVNSTGGGSTGGGSTGGGSTGGGSTGGGSTGGGGSTRGGGTTTPPPPPPTAPVCPAGFAPATITLGLTSYTFCAFSQ
jgi:uncharacterized membrane protein YgcG